MKFARWFAVLAAVIILAPSLADARAGGGAKGTGSRGSRTYQAPPPTQTAPAAKPIERSTTPQQQQAQRPGLSGPAAAGAQSGSFFSRNPFMSGLMGGLLGAGLFGMLFGGGFGAGLGGMSGMLGLLLQIALIGGLVYFGLRLFRGWSASRAAPAYASAGPAGLQRMIDAPMARTSGAGGAGAVGGGASVAGAGAVGLAVTEQDYNAFDQALGKIQAAFSNGDLGQLRSLVTPEMLGYFSEQLSANASRGVENKVEAVKLEQGDLAEAWSEGDLDYATVAMRFSLVDYTRRLGDGRIVEGSADARTEATEIWTFLRSRGGTWILSAIQQA